MLINSLITSIVIISFFKKILIKPRNCFNFSIIYSFKQSVMSTGLVKTFSVKIK